MTFKELNIIPPILKAIEAEGYTKPSPIQEQAIPMLLKGHDLLGCAQTGTGKTAAFAIPIIQNLHLNSKNMRGRRKIKALVVTPTRELAIQVGQSFQKYSKETNLRTTIIFGGVNQNPQVNAIRNGIDILVATPGRLLDLVNQKIMNLNDVEYFVLDEADQMLDMGFIHDIKRMLEILPAAEDRQSLFFSATMPPEIRILSSKILNNPEKVTIRPDKPTADRVEQQVYFVAKKEKTELLIYILQEKNTDSVIVFSRTKHGADKVVKQLERANIKAAAIHGNKSQNNRQRALEGFKAGDIKVLVATDIAARGIDVKELKMVINYDLPNLPETYVHRIGRTGRANASGLAVSFCDVDERPYLKDIQKLIGRTVPMVDDHPYHQEVAEADIPKKAPSQKQQNRGGRSGGGGVSRRKPTNNGGRRSSEGRSGSSRKSGERTTTGRGSSSRRSSGSSSASSSSRSKRR